MIIVTVIIAPRRSWLPIPIPRERQFVDRGNRAAYESFSCPEGIRRWNGEGEGVKGRKRDRAREKRGGTDIDSLSNLRDGSTRRLPVRGYDCRTTAIEGTLTPPS